MIPWKWLPRKPARVSPDPSKAEIETVEVDTPAWASRSNQVGFGWKV